MDGGKIEERVNGADHRPQLKIVELDEVLSGDVNGTRLRELVERLSSGKQMVLRELNKGVSSQDHARLTALTRAYDAGISALPKLWENLNRGDD